MDASFSGSDRELLARLPTLVLIERARSADVIEHLVELDRRRLYLDAACGSLSSYCSERLGYSEDEAAKRVRVTRLASRLPQVLEDLRTARIHLTGLCLLAPVLTPDNAEELLEKARGKSKRQIEELLARQFPQPDVPDRIDRQPEQLGLSSPSSHPAGTNACRRIGSGTGMDLASTASSRAQPLSASRWSVQFTASDGLREKIERARELLSHALPSGDLAALFERALDALIEQETKRRFGASGRPNRRRPLSPGSRHVPVEIARQVWERDSGQCTFIDEQGRRCSERRFITLEHIEPFALGGPPTLENLCLRCMSHNVQAARKLFGDTTIEAKRKERVNAAQLKRSEAHVKVHEALRKMGFAEPQVRRAIAELIRRAVEPELETLSVQLSPCSCLGTPRPR